MITGGPAATRARLTVAIRHHRSEEDKRGDERVRGDDRARLLPAMLSHHFIPAHAHRAQHAMTHFPRVQSSQQQTARIALGLYGSKQCRSTRRRIVVAEDCSLPLVFHMDHPCVAYFFHANPL